MTSDGTQQMWAEVLLLALQDATEGMRNYSGTDKTRLSRIKAARAYLTKQNKDFDIVCSLAGADPENMREGFQRKVAQAPIPDELMNAKRVLQAKPSTAKRTTKRIALKDKAVTIDGLTRTVSEWSQQYGVRDTTIRSRLERGFSIEQAITEPVKSPKAGNPNWGQTGGYT